MKLKRPATHVIFDLDGVLLDTEPIYTRATERIASEWGKRYSWELKAQVMGRSPLESAQRVVQALGLPITAEEYVRRREIIVRELLPSAPPIEGAPELVLTLTQRGFPMAVATSSERRLFGLKSRNHLWLQAIPVVICGDDPEAGRHKPAPDIFLAAARALGGEPANCLVFEDSMAGVAAAHAAGMQVIARVDSHLDPALFADADLVVRRYRELAVPLDLRFDAEPGDHTLLAEGEPAEI